MFCVTQIVINLSFWIEGYSSLWVIADELMKFGNRPQKMYIPAVRVLLGFILPIITILNLPADILIGAAEPKNVAIAVGAVIVLFAAMLKQWKQGLRRYQSASS